jgi:glycosyltransferase involved in cell wall biosynthesis
MNRKKNTVYFLDSSRSLHFDKIGGTNSIVRRVAKHLSYENNTKVILLDISKNNCKYCIEDGNIEYIKFRNIYAVIKYLHNISNKHVVDIYLGRLDRILYGIFRVLLSNNIESKLYTSWPDGFVKRLISFSDSYIFRYSGKLYCVSNRQVKYLNNRKEKKAKLLLPPVPNSYYISVASLKSRTNTIVWVGRLDYGKGADIVFKIIEKLSASQDYNFKILAHTINNKNSVLIPESIRQLDNVNIKEIGYSEHSSIIEKEVGLCFREADVFISPYRFLSSTIDTPMLIQEAMASLCAVVTMDFPGIGWLYGSNQYLVAHDVCSENLANEFCIKINQLMDSLEDEQERISHHLDCLKFSSREVASQFISDIQDDIDNY